MLTIDENDRISSSDDEVNHTNCDLSFQGTLSKWTNYLQGWQERFIVIKDGTLSYFKSEKDTSFGCRGCICTSKCQIKLHEFDECRFDVSIGDNAWFLRADSPRERDRWVQALEASRQVDSAYGSDNSLRRYGSAISLASGSQKNRDVKEKFEELELFRDVLFKKIDVMINYFEHFNKTSFNESIPSSIDSLSSETSSSGMLVDFKDEAVKFKTTCAGVMGTLSHCIDLMQQREDHWKRKLDEEIDKRRNLEKSIALQSVENGKSQVVHQHKRTASDDMRLNDPDYEEGPHSKIKEEEFFDAVDAMLDKKDMQEEEKRIVKMRAKEIGEPSSALPETCNHPKWAEIERITLNQLYHALLDVKEGEAAGWQLFAEEGEMRLYKRDLEIDGLVCDPLKAVHTVRGITAHEVCYHFFSPHLRWDWENTLEITKVVEEINANTLIFHQVHKRIWPATQRDAVFWSHIRRIEPNGKSKKSEGKLYDTWIVCNNSIDSDIPLGRCVRMKLTVSMTCETYIDDVPEGQEITRDNIKCRIIYCSTINPGGWAPASVLRSLYKREYPKFLKNYTQYVIDAQEKKPIMF